MRLLAFIASPRLRPWLAAGAEEGLRARL